MHTTQTTHRNIALVLSNHLRTVVIVTNVFKVSLMSTTLTKALASSSDQMYKKGQQQTMWTSHRQLWSPVNVGPTSTQMKSLCNRRLIWYALLIYKLVELLETKQAAH
jgi:hypothetical protein